MIAGHGGGHPGGGHRPAGPRPGRHPGGVRGGWRGRGSGWYGGGPIVEYVDDRVLCFDAESYPIPCPPSVPYRLSGLTDDLSCGVAQVEQRIKGILIGLVVGGAAGWFFGAKVGRR